MASRTGLRYLIVYLSFFYVSWVYGIERQPWIGNYLEFELRSSLRYETYTSIAHPSRLIHHAADDFFLALSLSNAIGENFSVEAEIEAARTHHQRGDIDHFSLAGRYVWLDNLLGDPVTLTTGAVLTQTFEPSLHDISVFHHGRSEAELFVSIGKDRSDKAGLDWESRTWLVAGVGVAERGSAWLRGDLECEFHFRPKRSLGAFIHSLWGLGHQDLHIHDFHGYGSIQHQSVDIGLRYMHDIEFWGHVSLEYARRVYARNCPAHVHQIKLTLLYTFGL